MVKDKTYQKNKLKVNTIKTQMPSWESQMPSKNIMSYSYTHLYCLQKNENHTAYVFASCSETLRPSLVITDDEAASPGPADKEHFYERNK